MPRIVKVAATQLEITRDPEKNLVCVWDSCCPATAHANSDRDPDYAKFAGKSRKNCQGGSSSWCKRDPAAGMVGYEQLLLDSDFLHATSMSEFSAGAI